MINLMDYDILTKDDFLSMAYGGAIIVKDFDPTTFVPPAEGDVALCTSGNININDNVTRLDLGADVNGLYFAYKELQVVTGKEASTVSCTALNFGADDIRRYLGAADIDETDNSKVNTRLYYKPSDFENLALVFPKVGGGYVALVMNNALSTGGLSITTTKDAKATVSVTFTAFRSIEAKTVPEIQYYSYDVTTESDIVISKQPASKTVEAGEDVGFSVSADGTGTITYQWQVMTPTDSTFSDISGKTAYNMQILDVSTDDDGNRYRCKISDGTTTVFTKTALLTVTDNA